jgi:hypothetical protein
MNVETGTEAPIFLFWEYLLQIVGIFSLQCSHYLFGYSEEQGWAKLVSNLTFSKRKAMVFSKNLRFQSVKRWFFP